MIIYRRLICILRAKVVKNAREITIIEVVSQFEIASY